jgi:hypothetical protein
MVEDMESRMTNQEFVNWTMYYSKQAQNREVESKMAEARAGR